MDTVKVLIVEDEFLIGKMLKTVLEQLWDGYEVTALFSGKDALALMETEKFHVLITDYRMPGMDGFELAKQTRALRDAPRVMILSAMHDPEYAEEAFRLGAVAYFKKPVPTEEIHQAIQKTLNK